MNHRRALWLTLAGLLGLTLCALLPMHLQGPFDARDFTRLPGMRLESSVIGALIEPWTAPFHILAGAPDFRLAGLVSVIWLIVGTAIWRAVADRHARPRRSISTRVLRSAAAGLAAGLVMTLSIGATVILRVPRWCLRVDDPNALIVDLHSHTYGSHDGLVSAAQNLAWHTAAGYNAVAVTEHRYPAGAFATQAYASQAPTPQPAVIPGQELSFLYQHKFLPLLLLGLQADYVESPNDGLDPLADYLASIHTAQQGATLAMGFTLGKNQAKVLADAGIDGFEIANYGHPNIPVAIRQEILEAARSHGLALVATSDWHGCGGIARTWTVIHADSPVATMSTQQKAASVLTKLRERGSADVVPVVAGTLGPATGWRAACSPVAETLRYAAELSPLQVVSWWLWSAAIFALARLLARSGWPAGRVLAAVGVTGLACIVLWGGWNWVAIAPNGRLASGFPRHIGTYALCFAAIALLAGAWLGRSAWHLRARRRL
ncbi:MAG: hypothetical protein DVB26_07320 [Verrucomicrobia bacterium]|nr:MAG: hypothetical protein DVB26_07320 [Verrucomicrobiota bacterium]